MDRLQKILEWPDDLMEIGYGHVWNHMVLNNDVDVWICQKCEDVLMSDPGQLTMSSSKPSCDQVVVNRVHGR